MPEDISHHRLQEGWRWVRLRELCRFVNGDAYKESDWRGEGIPIIRIQNLNDHSKPFNYWSGGLDDRVVVNPGDVLLAWSGTPGTSFGVHIWNRGSALLNQHIFRVDFQSDEILADWAAIAINHQLYVLIGKAHGGVGLRHVTKGEVESLEIPLPPPQEQRRIAAILNKQMAAVERARTAAEAQLEAAKALPAAYVSAVFSSSEARRWPRKPLREISDIAGGIQKTPDRAPIKFHRPYLTVRNVQRGFLDLSQVERFEVTLPELSRLCLQDGDILIVEGNGSLGHIGRNALFIGNGDEWIHQNHIIRVRLSRKVCLPAFVSRFLNSGQGSEQMIEKAKTSSGLYTLSAGKVGSLEVPTPSIVEQQRFAAMLNEQIASVERTRKAIEEELDAINELPAAILRRAFNGEL